jgi:phosphate transport system substrate-binding protein
VLKLTRGAAVKGGGASPMWGLRRMRVNVVRHLCALALGPALGVSAIACHRASQVPAPTVIRGDGSASLYPLVRAAAAAFNASHPSTRVEVVESGSGTGIERFVRTNDIQFVDASRTVKEDEVEDGLSKGKLLHMTVVAAEGLVVIVHPSNPVQGVSVAQLEAIYFTGAIGSWSSLDPSSSGVIHPVGVDPKKSGTGDFFVERVGGRGAKYVPAVKVVAQSDEGPAVVASDPTAVSFCSQSVARRAGPAVRVLEVGGILPTERSVLDTSYPLSRKLFVVTDGPAHGATGEFVKFLLGEQSQRLARAKGYKPIALGGE